MTADIATFKHPKPQAYNQNNTTVNSDFFREALFNNLDQRQNYEMDGSVILTH